MRHIIYLGAMLPPEESQKLLRAVPPAHERVFAHHVTLAFKPKADHPSLALLGQRLTLTVIGEARDAQGQAVCVAGVDVPGQVPHITVSCAPLIPPKYSNELLRGEQWVRIEQFTLVADVQAYMSDGSLVSAVEDLYPPSAEPPLDDVYQSTGRS